MYTSFQTIFRSQATFGPIVRATGGNIKAGTSPPLQRFQEGFSELISAFKKASTILNPISSQGIIQFKKHS